MIRAFMSKQARVSLAAVSLLAAAASIRAHAQDAHRVLAQLDAASAKFQSAQASFQWDEYELAVQQDDIQKGTIAIVRHGKVVDMAAHIDPPQQKDLVYRDGELKLYEPRIDHLTVFAAGKNKATYESFLTLGFGGGGTELAEGWDVKDLGPEKVDGVDTEKLELVSKQQAVRNVFAKVILSIDPTRAISLKQQFFEPDGDYRIAHYTQIKVNAAVPPAAFAIKTTAKTSVVHK